MVAGYKESGFNWEGEGGIHVTRDLKSEEQCTQSARKAQAVLGMVKRHFKELDKEDFMVIYKAYIRPHLEYCVQAWSPHLIKDKDCLEQIQRRATRLAKGLKKLTYEDRLKQLGIYTRWRNRDYVETWSKCTKYSKKRKGWTKPKFFNLPWTHTD